MPQQQKQITNDRLRRARVHIGGMGRIGTNIAIALHEAGVGIVSANDPQTFEQEQLEVCSFSRRSDLGRSKVHVLERYFDGREGFVFLPIVAQNQSKAVLPYLEAADVIVSCANDLRARLHLERVAVRLAKPSIQVAAQDARQSLGGLITRWLPRTNLSCFACLFRNENQRFRRGEVLLPTVLKALAGFASNSVTDTLIREDDREELGNVLFLDMKKPAIERIRVMRAMGCTVCRSHPATAGDISSAASFAQSSRRLHNTKEQADQAHSLDCIKRIEIWKS